MSALLLHVQDTRVALYEGSALLGSSPGVAVLDASGAKFGHSAFEHFRLRPRWVQTRFWQEISEKECQAEQGERWSYADLACEHVARLTREAGAERREVVIALPAHYDTDALALMLGVIKSAGLKPVGLIDAAILECGQLSESAPAAHLDIHLNQAIVTRLSSRGAVKKVDFEIFPEMGWAQILGDWSEWFARRFVEETRFDPHHTPDAEQKLFDQLRAFGSQQNSEPLRISLEAGSKVFSLDVSNEAWSQAGKPTLDRLVDALSSLESVAVSAVAMSIPGLMTALSEVTRVVPLAEDALATNFDQRRGALITGEHRLQITDELAPEASAPEHGRPVTHLLVGGHAWPIGNGLSIVKDRGTVGVRPFNGKGNRVWKAASGARIDPSTTDNLELDGRRVAESTRLEPGMVLSLSGCPGEVTAIHELSHGA